MLTNFDNLFALWRQAGTLTGPSQL